MAILGIDLGTTNSLAAVWREGKSVLVPNTFGAVRTPSVVSVDDDGSILTGETAKQRLVSHPEQTAALFKQSMGQSKTFSLGGRVFSPEELSAVILRSLKEDAEAFLGEPVTEAIISVPAYFNDSQRYATKTAGRIAGLTVDRILNEPSAAALAYRQTGIYDGTNLVFDFGGGTLDISVLEAFDNIVDILSVTGDNHLGGSDIDTAIRDAFLAENPSLGRGESEQEQGILLKTAEMCKIALTDKPIVHMSHRSRDKEYSMTIDNRKLLEICAPILARFKELIHKALQNADTPLSSIDHVILVGGSCRMPLVRECLRQITRQPVLCELDPDLVVAQGVGVAAGIKERHADVRDMILTDICPFSLGVDCVVGKNDDVFSCIIPRNTALPASRVAHYSTLKNKQTILSFKIYQGESLKASENTLLGECVLKVPPLPKGEATATARFTYDINGILECEFQCDQSGDTARQVIISNNRLSEGEIHARLKELESFKKNPREQEAHALLIARGRRLYEEFPDPIREQIADMLLRYEDALETANPARIARERTVLCDFFDRLDAYSESLLTGEAEPFAIEPDEWKG